jgi:hypothetical protein
VIVVKAVLTSYWVCRPILIHQKEMIPWLWTWAVWGRAKCGSMGIASEDIGLFMLKEIAVDAAIRLHSGLQGANWAVANQLKNGKSFFLQSN